MKIGRITLVDAATPTLDPYGAENEKVIAKIFEEPTQFLVALVTNSDQMRDALIRFCDVEKCPLVVTMGGTGPGRHDITPEATRAILDRELPGFSETMRHYSYEKTPLAILSRAIAGVRRDSLVLNLPARPKATRACLHMLREPMVECIRVNTGTDYVLFVDPITIPIEQWFPFLKRFRPKTGFPDSGHPTIGP